MQEWLQLLKTQLQQTHVIEWLVLVFGVSEVLLAKANNIWLYPTGIVSVLLSIYVLFTAKLYAECLLSCYYLVMSIYGWWHWVKKKNQAQVKISYSNRSEWIITALISGGGFFLLAFVLKSYTDSNVPYWDAFVSATAWAGMWLLAKRKIENWILLNISNAAAIPLLFYKELMVYAILTIFLFIVAIQGFLKWQRLLREEKETTLFVIE